MGGYIVKTSVIAEIIGRTEQRVNQLAKEGVLSKQAPSKWDLAENMKKYIAFLESGRKRDESLAALKQVAEADHKRHQADIAGLVLRELEGRMHRSEDVADMTADMVYTMRGMLQALPGRLAMDVAATSDPAEVSALVRSEVHALMTELSRYEYDSARYAQRVRKRRGWGADGQGSGSGAQG